MTADKPERGKRCFEVHVDPELCDGCGVCIFFCKPEIFHLSARLNHRGIYPALTDNPELCTGCALCELGCPQLAIAIVEKRRKGDAA